MQQIISECKQTWQPESANHDQHGGQHSKKVFAEDMISEISTSQSVTVATQKLDDYITNHNDELNQREKRNLKKKLKRRIKKEKKKNPDNFIDQQGDDESSEKEEKEKITSSVKVLKKTFLPTVTEPESQTRQHEIFSDPFE